MSEEGPQGAGPLDQQALQPLQEACPPYAQHMRVQSVQHWTPKKFSGSARPCQKDYNAQGANFKQIVHTECKKAFCTVFKKAARGKKRRNHCNESDSDSDSDF